MIITMAPVAALALLGALTVLAAPLTFAPGASSAEAQMPRSIASLHRSLRASEEIVTNSGGNSLDSANINTVLSVRDEKHFWGDVEMSSPHDTIRQILLDKDRKKRAVYATPADGQARLLATVNSYLRVVVPQGFIARVDCPDGSAINSLNYTAYGLLVLNRTAPGPPGHIGRIVAQRVTVPIVIPVTPCVCSSIPGVFAAGKFMAIDSSKCSSSKFRNFPHEVCSTVIPSSDIALYPNAPSVIVSSCLGLEKCDVDAETGVFLSPGAPLPLWDQLPMEVDEDEDDENGKKMSATKQTNTRIVEMYENKVLAIEAQCRPFCRVPAPSTPFADVRTTLRDVYNRSAGATATYQCRPGYAQVGGTLGVVASTSCDTVGQEFPPPPITCSACGIGFYCPGDGRRYPCGNGTFSNSATDTTEMCSGYCEPGFLCLQPGARTSTTNPCGGAGEFICPRNETLQWRFGCNQGQGWQLCDKRPLAPTLRVRVPANAYSAPLSVPVTQRYFWQACPWNRQCRDGLILPHFTWRRGHWWTPLPMCFSADGFSGRADITIDEGRQGAVSTLSVEVETPGFPSTEFINWTVSDSVWQPSSRWFSLDYQSQYRGQRRWQRCPVSSLEVFGTRNRNRVAGLRTRQGFPALTWEQCGRRFPVVIRAARPGVPASGVECLVNVNIRRSLSTPVIDNCGGLGNVRRVEEGVAPGTAVGAPLQGSQLGGLQPGVVMRYILPDFRDRNDFAVDTCTGQIFTSDIINKTTTADADDIRTLRVEIIADGASLGMGTSSIFCNALLNVTRRNSPPVVFTSELTIAELRPAGSLVGTIDVADPDMGDETRVRLSLSERLALLALGYSASNANGDDSRDPGAFSIDPVTGEVRTTRQINALQTGVYAYYLLLNASDGRAWAVSPLTITITPVPRPPSVPAQSVSIMEFNADGSRAVATPALIYSHPLNDNVTWWLSPETTFEVVPSAGGRHSIALKRGVRLDYYVQGTYFVTAFARDSSGNVASGSVTINVVEANRAPFWVNSTTGVFNMTLRDQTPPGSALPGRLLASDSNMGDRIVYRLVSSVPSQAAAAFSVDSTTGQLRLISDNRCPGGCPYQYNRGWSWPRNDAFTILLTVEARDNGVPSLWVTGTVRLSVVDVRPQLSSTSVSLSSAAVNGAVVGTASVWIAPRSPPGMSALSYSFSNLSRSEPFSINNITGQVRVANAALFDFTVTRSYSLPIQVRYTLPLPAGSAVSTGSATLNTSGLTEEQAAAAQQVFDLARTQITVTASATMTVNMIHVNRPPSWNATGLRIYAPFRWSGRIGPALRAFVLDPDLGIVMPTSGAAPLLRPEALTFRIAAGNTADRALAINATDGQLSVVLVNSPALQFVQGRAPPVITLTIEVCDAGVSARVQGVPRCANTSLPVEVLEGNMPPSITAASFMVDENSAVGTLVGQPLTATDPDPGTVLRFSILQESVQGAFSINEITGQISSAVPLDFEARSRYSLLVLVTDSGRVPLSSTAEVAITVRDVAEAPSFIGLGPFSVPENSPMRTTVGFVNATDPDAADARGLRYSIIGLSQGWEAVDSRARLHWNSWLGAYLNVSISFQESRAPFAIDALTGEIWLTTNALNMEERSTYVISVRVTDSAGLRDDQQVTVSVLNVNDRPAADDMLLYMNENSFASSIFNIPVTDDDFRQEHVFLPGPHFGTHYCTGWQNRKQLEVNWESSFTEYQWPHTAGAHIDLRLVPTGQSLTVDFRMGGAGAGIVALSGSEEGTSCSDAECADRYEVEVDGRLGGLTVRRFRAVPQSSTYTWNECTQWNSTGACTLTQPRTYTYVSYRADPVRLFNSTFPSLLSSPDGTMGNFYLRLRDAGWRTIEVGRRSDNSLTATYTPLATVTDSNSALSYLSGAAATNRLYVTTVGSTPSRRISSVCFSATPFVSTGNMLVDYQTGAVTIHGLDFETRRFVGQEYEIFDMPAGSALSPAYLNTYSVVEAAALDVNEAPQWNASAMVECPNSTVALVLACITVPEGTAAGTVLATIPTAIDPDRFWQLSLQQSSSRTSPRQVDAAVDYSFRLDNVPRAARVVDFSNASSARSLQALHGSDSWFGEWTWGLNHSSRDVVVVSPELLDYESSLGAPQEFRVWASDIGGWTASAGGGQRLTTVPAIIVVRVSDVNERPSLSPRTGVWTVEEMSLEGTLVGTPSDWNARDPDTAGTPFSTLTFSLTGGSGSSIFGVHPTTGQVFVAPGAVLDFERVSSYNLTVTVSDGGSPSLSASATITIRVVDVNEPPVLLLPAFYDVPESATNLLFGAPLTVQDPDAGSFFTWSVTGGTGASLFDVNCDGKIVVRPDISLNFEQEVATTYTLTIRVIDNGSPGLSAENSTTIRITDVNEFPAVSVGQRFTVLEASAPGTVLGTVQWSDPDTMATSAAWRTATFSLASEGNVQGLLEVHPTTGVLQVGTRPLTRIVNPADDADVTLSLFVDVTDGGGLRVRAPIEVKVIGINYPPAWLSTNGWVLTVEENTPSSPKLPGDAVGSPLPATDRNAKHVATLAFSITGVWPTSGRSFFDVQSSAESAGQAQLVLAGTAGLNFEAVKVYTIELQVMDVFNTTARVNVTVQVTDRNEAPTVTYPAVLAVPESMRPGVEFGAPPTASDPEGDTITYRTVGGNGTAVFGVNPATGRLFVLPGVSLDYETAAWYSLQVAGTDSGLPDGTAAALSSTATLSVSVTDVNERPTWPASVTALSLPENSAPGTDLTPTSIALATDVDEGDSLTYGIDAAAWTAANPAAFPATLFAVSAAGAVTVGPGAAAGLLNYEGVRTFTLPVNVRDAAGLNATRAFTVSLSNVNEAPSWGNLGAWSRVFVRLSGGNTIGRPLSEFATDVDMSGFGSQERLAYAIAGVTATQTPPGGSPTAVSENLTPFVSIGASTGQLSLGDVSAFPSFGQTGVVVSVSVTVVVTDSSDASATNVFTFSTTDNNNPPACAAQALTVPEGSPSGFVLGQLNATDPDPGTPVFRWSLSQSPASAGQTMVVNVTNAGSVFVTSSGASMLDFETQRASSPDGTPVFTVVATVSDSNPNFPLTAQCMLTVTLTDVNEAPRLRPVSMGSTPASFTLTLPENSAAGSVLQLLSSGTATFASVLGAAATAAGPGSEGRATHLSAIDEDAADSSAGSLVFSLEVPSSVPASLFSVNPSTGLITVSASASTSALARLDFESPAGNNFTFTAVVTDRAGASDRASVTVLLSDVNDAPAWGLLSLPAGGSPSTAVTSADTVAVAESLPPGTVIVRVTASDVDAGLAGSLRFALLSDGESTPFSIDAVTGVLSLAPTTVLDWESKAVWTPTVTVADQSSAPITLSKVVTIRVMDVFDVSITEIALGSGQSAQLGLNVDSSSPFALTHPQHSVLVRTEGSVRIRFTGLNVGLSSARLAAEGRPADGSLTTDISATYGPTTGLEYTAGPCKIIANGRDFECTTVASVGRDFIWTFTIGHGAEGAVNGSLTVGTGSFTRRTGTLPPVITSVQVTEDEDGTTLANPQRLSTLGGDFLAVRGRNFGPVGTPVFLSYSTGATGAPLYLATACTVRTAHTLMVCTSAPGVGRNLVFQAAATTAQNQTSAPFLTSVNYAAPLVTALSAPLLATAGGEMFQIIGENFGPASAVSGAVTVAYSSPQVWALTALARAQRGVSDLIYAAQGCLINNDTVITCSSAPGVGAGLIPVVAIAAQSNSPTAIGTPTLSYKQPNITALGGTGIDRMPTTGGTVLRLTGTDFGPQFNVSAERLQAITSNLGVSFLPIPAVSMGQLYLTPTAPVRPLGYIVTGPGACSAAELGARCMPKQCGTSRAVCNGEQWSLETAPFGQVCFEREVGGVVQAEFIPSTDDRCVAVETMRYQLNDCSITTPHTGITCTVPPGVGKWLYVTVSSVGRQAGMSPVPVVSYAPPVITEFNGEGATGASTAGSQNVTIRGMNFGDSPSDLRAVTYGTDSREFPGVSCSLAVPHTEIRCTTSPGAGARLAWTVRINNQDSVTPLTDYAAPSIDSISGPGASNAATAGGSIVVLTGKNFATTQFMDFVTYGPTGREYTAANCSVTVAHIQITCRTVPGTGRSLQWRVSVRGQVSRPSTQRTSYAAPLATDLSTASGTTSGVQGVLLYGRDLGVAAPGAVTELYVDRYGASGVSFNSTHSAQWMAWRQAMLNGDAVAADELRTPSITAWLSSASSLPVYAHVQLPGEEALLFDIPDGCGSSREVVVFVDGVPSNLLFISYQQANISNVAPVRDTNGNLILVVEGSNFCGTPMPIPPSRGIARILLGARPNATQGINSLILSSEVNSAAQNPPDVDAAILSQSQSGGGSSAGGRRLVQAVGQEDMMAMEVEASSAVGRGIRRLQESGGSPGSSPTTAMCITVDSVCVRASVATTRRFEAVIPEPAGLGAGVAITVSMQTSQGEVRGRTFDAPAPYFDDSSAYSIRRTGRQLQAGGRANLDGMDTAGGERVFFPGVTSLQTESASDVVVTIGGRPCTDVQLTGRTGTALTNYIWTVSCLTPPGIGRNLTMSVCSLATSGGCSPSFDNRAFSYAAPTVLDVLDGAASVLIISTAGTAIPTSGKTLIIRGKGFGQRAILGTEFTAKVTVTLLSGGSAGGSPGLASTVDAPVLSQSDTQLEVAFPEGYGSVASVLVQTQRTSGFIMGESYVQDAPAVSVRYAAPIITGVSSTGRGTVGGAVVTLTGSGFGAPSAGLQPTVTLGGSPCPVLTYTHSQLTCTLPPGQGSAVSVVVTLADLSSTPSTTARFAYAPPTLTAVSPLAARTDGLRADGTPVEMTLRGTNMGPAPVVHLVPTSPAAIASGMRTITVPTSAIRRLDPGHDVLVVPVPEGAGRDLRVVLVSGDQSSVATSFSFNYDQPRITGVTRLGRTEDACRPRTEAIPRVRDGIFVNRTSRPDCFPTLGGYLLSVAGSSMGPADVPVLVVINGTACAVQYHSHSETVCRVSAGMGTNLPVSLSAGGQTNVAAPLVTFSYDAPVVLNVMPNIPFAVGGERLIIYGYNFGIAATRIAIRVGGLPCADPRYVNDSQVTCVAPKSTVGPKSLSIDIANRNAPFVYSAEEEVVIYQCKMGWYGTAGEECINCASEEPGADCPGGELYYDLVIAQPGWYRVNVSQSASSRDRKELCHPMREAGRRECPAFLPCTPTSACLGANRCAVGYVGARCGTCDEGFYKLNGQCVACPDRTSAVVILFIVFCLSSVAITYLMVSKGATWTMLMMCIDYAQVLALMNRFSIKWPAPSVTRWMVAASASFLNLELVAPECSIKSTTFAGKWAAVQVLPLLIGGMLLATFVVKKAYLMVARPGHKGGVHHAFVGTGMVLFRLLYVYFARNSLDAFNCAPLSQGDTKTEYLSSNLDIPCYQGVHWQMVGAGIAGIILYLVLLPMYMGWSLYKGSKGVVFMDQLARARGYTPPVTEGELGLTEPTHPDAAFRRVWNTFYAPYRPNYWYWEGVIAARKFMIIFTSLMYNRTTTFQQALCLLALFVSAALHVRVRPYFTADTATRLLVKYEPKVQMKASEEAQKAKDNFNQAQARRHEMESTRAASFKATGATGGRMSLAQMSSPSAGDNNEAKDLSASIEKIKYLRAVHSLAAVKTRKAQMQRRVVMGYPILSLFLDYNQVESVLIASLILQGLAGVMFGSSLFAGANLERFFADQYDAMAGATATLLAATALYMLLCLALDAWLSRDPDSLQNYAHAYLGWNAHLEEVMADKASLFGTSDRILVKSDARHPQAHVAGITQALGGQEAQAQASPAPFSTANPMLSRSPPPKSKRALASLPDHLVANPALVVAEDGQSESKHFSGDVGVHDEERGQVEDDSQPMSFAPVHASAFSSVSTAAAGGAATNPSRTSSAALMHSLVSANQQLQQRPVAVSPTTEPAAVASVPQAETAPTGMVAAPVRQGLVASRAQAFGSIKAAVQGGKH